MSIYYVPEIALINESTVVTDDEVKALVEALQYQVHFHMKKAWNVGAHMYFLESGKTAHAGSWQIAILDDSDQAGALGYHDLTNDDLPLAKVFAKTDKDNGLSWTITTSHELCEMLVDPYIFSSAQVSNTEFYALEVCDSCEADNYGYDINGITVSDFVTPRWFQPGVKGPYDHGGHIKSPLEILPGGYISIFVSGKGWTQKTNFEKAPVRVCERDETRAHKPDLTP